MIEFQRKKLKFKLDGQEYGFNFPTVGQYRSFNKKLKNMGEGNEFDCMIEFLVSMGLNAEIAEGMEVDHITAIFDEISGQKKS